MSLATLHDLLSQELRGLYQSERELVGTLDRLEKAATSSNLQGMFREHRVRTRLQLRRLERAMNLLEARAAVRQTSDPTDDQDLIGRAVADGAVKDAALICAAQKVAHFEIAGYSSAGAIAQELGMNDVADLLHQTLLEEMSVEEALTDLARQNIHQHAALAVSDV